MELTKEANEAAIQTAQKVEDVANVVSQAVASNPDASMPMTPPPTVEPAEVPPAIEDINPDGEFNPDNVPPAEGTEGTEGTTEVPPAEEQPPVEEQTTAGNTPAEVPPAEDTEVSDIRQKRISRMKSNWGKTHTQKKMEASSFKPTAGMIEAASKGY